MKPVEKIKIFILIPTFNEYENIATLLKKIYEIAKNDSSVLFSIYIIDDSSPDGTAELVVNVKKELVLDNYSLNLLSRYKKEGLGKAYIWGFNYLKELDQKPDYVLQMDADLSHDPKYIPSFVMAARVHKPYFIVGARYIFGGSIPSEWPVHRKFLSIFGNFYTRKMLGDELTDYTGGFNMYSMELINAINFDEIHSNGYGFLIDLKFTILKHNKLLIQIPIAFSDRKRGKSKMPLNTVLDNFFLVFKLKFFK